MTKPPAELPLETLIAALRGNETFFLAGHLNPDGDTIGCALCMASVLRRMGKHAWIYSADPVPDNLSFLHGASRIHVGKLPRRRFDAAILLECSTPKRGGNIGEVLSRVKTVINIDHHRTFENYGTVNYVDPTASSTAELLYGIISAMDIRLNSREAEYLYVGLATDTGRFHYPATTARTHRVAAALVEAGVKPSKVNDKIYSTRAFPALKLLGTALSNLTLCDGGRTAVSELTRADILAAKALPQHTEDIVNFGLMAPGVQVSLLFREEESRIAVNFRSKGLVDVSRIAKSFGGGGHKTAAGCKSTLPLEQIRPKVLAAVKAAQDDAQRRATPAKA
ncbi:MAG: bifunctional oligoribonuclease/PAP phosphatase NrnA [Elusimicrobiales bacterium]|nr:bifunctional oligoribonuclease/PAP phosphatase NrnA [Elusimicrobiales bacterium]